MRDQRLSTETSRAKKELQFYEQKRDLSKKLKKIEETRIRNIEKLEAKEKNALDDDELDDIAMKKQRNLEKIFKYQQRKNDEKGVGRVFKQRKPILNDHANFKRQKQTEEESD